MVPKRVSRTAYKRQNAPRMSRSGQVLIFEAPKPFQEHVLGILELHVGLHNILEMVILHGRGIQNQYFSVFSLFTESSEAEFCSSWAFLEAPKWSQNGVRELRTSVKTLPG